jgi:hypothetical protein
MDTIEGQVPECGGYHATSKIIHLDYVGHAALTDRLLDTDLEWSWEPVGFTPEGLPALDRNGGLWIKLTVCGVTRYGYGAADGKSGGDAMKEMIGDALRNAAMRFGARWTCGTRATFTPTTRQRITKDDMLVVKLCRNCHQGKGGVHDLGGERQFLEQTGWNLVELAVLRRHDFEVRS